METYPADTIAMASTYLHNWIFKGNRIGMYHKATLLNEMPFLRGLPTIADKTIACLHPGMLNETGDDIGDLVSLRSVAKSAYPIDRREMRTWFEDETLLNVGIAPSLRHMLTKKGFKDPLVSRDDMHKILFAYEKRQRDNLQKSEAQRQEQKNATVEAVAPTTQVAQTEAAAVRDGGDMVMATSIARSAVGEDGATVPIATMLPPRPPLATSKDGPFTRKMLRDIHDDGFAVDSYRSVRMKTVDNTAATVDTILCGDLLLHMGMYENFSAAQAAIMQLMQDKHDMIRDLGSFEINTTLLRHGAPLVLASLPDAIKLLNRLGVCTVSNANASQVEALQGVVDDRSVCPESGGPADVSGPALLREVAASFHKTLPGLHTRDEASLDGRDLLREEQGQAVAVVNTGGNVDSVSNEIVTQDAVSVASGAVQDVIMSHIEVAVASDAVQDGVTPPIEMAAAANVPHPVITRTRTDVRKVPGSVLKTISGLAKLDASRLEGRDLRRVQPGQFDENDEDIGGRWTISDAISVCTGDIASTAHQWVKTHLNAIKKVAKSLTFIDVGHPSVRFTKSTKQYQ